MRKCYWAVLLCLWAGLAAGAEKSSFAADRLALEAATAPALGADDAAESLASLKGNGKIKIGGGVQVRYAYTRVKAAEGTFAAANPGLAPAGDQAATGANAWETQTASLSFRVDATESGWLTLKLDIDDSWDGQNQDDFLEEAYFTLDGICGGGLGLKVGKQEVPFGMDKDILMVAPYLHGSGDSFLNGTRNGANAWSGNYGFTGAGAPNWLPSHTTEYDNNFAFVPYYKGDNFQLEASVFQGRNQNSRAQNPFVNRRETNDPGLSFSTRAAWTPTETLKVMASGITFHNRERGDVADVKRWYAASLAFDWSPEIRGRKVNFFGEWQHGWDVDFNDGRDSDDLHVGTSFGLTDKITFFAQYEWLNTDDAARDQTIQRAIAAFQYKLAGGMYWEAGYQREWGRIESNSAAVLHPHFNGGNSAHSDTFYCGMGYSF